jgi:capsular exopolysaccharide synthesis family protein
MNVALDEFDEVPLANSLHAQVAEGNALPPLLRQYWEAALRRKFTILGIIAAALVAGIVITLVMSPKYTARTQLEIAREQKQITNVEGLDAPNAAQDQEFYATQYALLKTRPVAERVARDLRLASNDEFFASHGVDAGQVEEASRGNARARETMAVELLMKNVDISPVRTSSLVDILYSSRSPEMSARIANAWAAAFIAVSMDRQFASTADARKFLEQRLASLREKLEQSESAAVNYAADQGIVAIDQERNADGKTIGTRTLAAANLDALNQALNDAIADRVKAQAALIGSGANSPEALTSNTLASLRQQREAAAAQAAQMSAQFDEGYPALQALRKQIASLDTAIARETNRVGLSRQQVFQQAAQREATLRSQVNALKGQMTAQNRASIQYNIYQRDADTNRQLYDALLQRYKEIGVAGTVGVNNIAVVEPAQIPTSPSSPNLILNVLLSLIAGVVAALAVTVALEQIDEGIRNPAQVQSRLNLPLVGITPAIDGSSVIDELGDKKSILYEAYFSIRSNLAFTTHHGFPRSLSVTSTRPGEGKSSTTFALASILSRLGKRVVLVDGDMRSPTAHLIAGTGVNKVGLSNYLAGDDNWQGMVQATRLPALSVLTAGPIPPSAAELLSGDRFAHLIEELLRNYDHVLVDSPPILGLSDAPVISRAVEGCVIVVESEGVAVRGVRASIERLRMVGAHIFGVVLTKVDQKSDGYGYGYGYGYGGARYGEGDGAAITA